MFTVNNNFVSSIYGFNLNLNHQQYEKELSNLTWFHMNFDPDPNVTYRFHISATRGQGELTLYTEIPQGTLVNTYVGGLRIKEVRNISNKDPDVVKTYEYKNANGTSSSGVLYSPPVYGSTVTGQTLVYAASLISFNSESIVPMGSFDGYHISYKRVIEKSVANGQKIMEFDITQSAAPFSVPVSPALFVPGNGDLINEEYKSQVNVLIRSELNTYKRASSQINTIFLKARKIDIGCVGYQSANVYSYISYRPVSGVSSIGGKTTVLDGVSTVQSFNYDFNLHTQPISSTMVNSNGQTNTHNFKYINDLPSGPLKTDLIIRNLLLPAVQDDAFVNDVQIDGSKIDYYFYDVNGNPTSAINVPYPFQYSRYRSSENTPGQFTGQWVVEGTNNTFDMLQGKPKTFTARGWLATEYTWQNGQIKSRKFKDHIVNYNYYTGTRLLSSIVDKDGQSTNYFYDPILRLDSIRARGGNVTTRFQYQFKNNLSTQNWIKSTTRFTTVASSALNIKEDFQYFDGLGRPIQLVSKEASPIDKKDIITAMDYDEEGRSIKSYEPFKTATANGAYTTVPVGTKFTATTFEASLLNRPLSNTPPDWYPSNQIYASNNSSDLVGYYDGASAASIFAINTLTKSITQDPDGNKTISFTDKKGRVILHRKTTSAEAASTFNDTYTLYDLKDRVMTIIPPGANLSTPELLFKYTYDAFDNVITKKVPGQALVQLAYDTRNLTTALQNGLLLAAGRWIGNHYDDYGRMSESGYTSSSIDPYITSMLIQHFYDGYDGATQLSLSSFPQYTGRIRKSRFNNLNAFEVGGTWNESTYSYDTYGRNTTATMSNHISSASDVNTNVYDYSDLMVQTTRTHTAHNNTNLAIDRKYTFDHRGRSLTSTLQIGGGLIKTINSKSYSIKDELTQNSIGGNLQTIDYTYNTQSWLIGINGARTATDLFSEELKYFDTQVGTGSTGKKNGSISQQTIETQGRLKQFYNFNYDYLDRLTASTTGEFISSAYTLNNKYNETYAYDPRGNILSLTRKGEMPTGISTFQNTTIDNLTYAYTTSTNTLSTVTDALDACPASYMVTQGIYTPITISASSTLTANSTVDASNIVRYTAGTSISLLPGFSSEAYGTGNFLASIAACGANKNNHEGFSQNTVNPYIYDVDGDQTYDPNKGLSFAYNYLHLPYVAQNASGCNRIEWVYDASGKKVQQKIFNKGVLAQTTDYLDGIEYKTIGNSTPILDAIYHEEGRYLPVTQKYEYILRDHLGNTRLSFIDNDANGTIAASELTQESYYYAFGMTMKGPWSNNNAYKYQYNGKENVQDIGLGLYDYGARWYDAGVGRWTTVDPLADKMPSWSTFNYGFNNPIMFTDPTGMAPDNEYQMVHNANGTTTTTQISTKGGDQQDIIHHSNGVPIPQNGASGHTEVVDNTTGGQRISPGVFAARASSGAISPVDDPVSAVEKGSAVAGFAIISTIVKKTDDVVVAVSSRAARRKAMREAGIPTSQPLIPDRLTNSKDKVFLTRDGKSTVQNATNDASHQGQPHWEAGRTKSNSANPEGFERGGTGRSLANKPQIANPKTKVYYND